MKRTPGLDLLRAMAIVWVMWFHSYIVGGTGKFADVMRWSGWMGVDLFFALSGYLIGSQVLEPLSRGQRLSLRDFYLRRAFRIIPAFGIVLAIYFLIPSVREVQAIRPLWQFITFTMNLIPAPNNQQAFSHAWSLCVEEHFYFAFPLIALMLSRQPSKFKLSCVVLGVLVGGMILRGSIWLHDVATPPAGVDPWILYMRYLYVPTWARLDGLLCGVLLAVIRFYRPRLWQAIQSKSNAFGLAALVVIAGCVALFNNHRADFTPLVFGYPLLAVGMACLVACASNPTGLLGKTRLPGIQWLATISYSLYLTHKAVYASLNRYLGASINGHGVITFLVYVAAALAVASVLYYSVEGPFLKFRSRFLKPRPDKARAVTVIGA